MARSKSTEPCATNRVVVMLTDEEMHEITEFRWSSRDYRNRSDAVRRAIFAGIKALKV